MAPSFDHSLADASGSQIEALDQPLQLKLDIYAAEGRARAPSVDSGYGTSPSLRSSLGPAVWQLYEAWKAADDAAQRLPAEVQALETCQSLLREAKKRRGAVRNTVQPKRRLSSMSLPALRKRSMHSVAPASTYPMDFTASAAPFGESFRTVEQLETEVDELQRSVAQTRVVAEQLDECFDKLLLVLDGGCPVSPESLRSPSIISTDSRPSQDPDLYRRARKTVAARDGMHLVTLSTTKALQHACRAVQAAHHLYQEAKENVDLLCGPNRSKLAVIFSDEESRNRTYLEAATRAQEAQACYDECLNSLRPHWDLLTRPELEAYENLHNTGLLQAATLYRLMYGGPNFAMGIKQEVQFMIQRQHEVFLQLTNFAAGVQNCTAHCEAVEREARASRDAARRQLITVYAQADEDIERASVN
ncbi:hypothetical protein VTO73DRAFT_5524 [Trametes versicolor]